MANALSQLITANTTLLVEGRSKRILRPRGPTALFEVLAYRRLALSSWRMRARGRTRPNLRDTINVAVVEIDSFQHLKELETCIWIIASVFAERDASAVSGKLVVLA